MLRLPPDGFVLSDVHYSCSGIEGSYRELTEAMRALYPELNHWRDDALFDALGEYGEHVEFCADFSVPTTRNEALIGYLYACQVMPVYRFVRFSPKNIDEAWHHYDAGTSEIHALELFDKIPALSSIFKTREELLGFLSKR